MSTSRRAGYFFVNKTATSESLSHEEEKDPVKTRICKHVQQNRDLEGERRVRVVKRPSVKESKTVQRRKRSVPIQRSAAEVPSGDVQIASKSPATRLPCHADKCTEAVGASIDDSEDHECREA